MAGMMLSSVHSTPILNFKSYLSVTLQVRKHSFQLYTKKLYFLRGFSSRLYSRARIERDRIKVKG